MYEHDWMKEGINVHTATTENKSSDVNLYTSVSAEAATCYIKTAVWNVSRKGIKAESKDTLDVWPD